jgi:hypothetical protein
MIRRLTSALLTVILAAGVAPVVFAQQGVISGRATSEARKPYANYTVQLVDVSNRQVTGTVPLDPQGQFAFSGIQVDKQYLVQLFSLRENKIVCTEGPYPLIAPDQLSKTDVNIKCGKPVAPIILGAVAAAAATAGVALQSASQ